MPTMKLTADLRAFSAALRKVKEVTRKEEADIVNKALKDVAFRAASFTPKAQASIIRNRLLSDGLLPALASIACNKKYGKNMKGARAWGKAEHAAMMLNILAARRRGIGALRAGWIPAILKFGGKYRGAKLKPGGSASHGTASKATIANLSGFIENAVEVHDHAGRSYTADEIRVATLALQNAVAFVTRDRENYAQRKIDALLTKHSD